MKVKSVNYTGKQVAPKVVVKYRGKTLKQGTDYSVTYLNKRHKRVLAKRLVNVGDYYVKITGKGSYKGSVWRPFTIKPTTSKTSPENMKSFADLSEAFPGMTWLDDPATYVKTQSFIIPGMRYSATGEKALCDAMIPQGLCVAGKYMLISAYCWHHSHSSVIYVLNKQSGRLVSTIALQEYGAPFVNHVGGLCFDGHNVWVATTAYTISGKPAELRIPLSVVNKKAKSSVANLEVMNYFVSLKGSKKIPSASFNTYYKGLLWVGWCNTTGTKNAKGTLVGYKVDGNRATKVIELSICSHANYHFRK